MADANIEVDVIIQNVSHDGKTDFRFTVHRNDYTRALDLLQNKVGPATGAVSGAGRCQDPVRFHRFGIGMRAARRRASKMFRALSEEASTSR